MSDYNVSDLDNHRNSLNGDLESLKGHLDSFVRSYEEVSNRCQCKERDYAALEKCAQDYQYALKVFLENYGDLLALSTDSELSEDCIKEHIQNKLVKMKELLASKDINLQYQIPGKKYVEPNIGEPLPTREHTTHKDMDGVVKESKIG